MNGLSRRRAMSILGALIAAPALRAIAHAQRPVPLLAVLEPGSATGPPGGERYFREALTKLGWVEGRTIRVEIRHGEWRADHMVAMARELVALRPAVLYTHSDLGARAAMQATTTIPIVVGASADLVAVAGMRSVAQPGGNVTGVSANQPELDRKRLEILKEAVPSASKIGYVFNRLAISDAALQALDESARRLGVRVIRAGIHEPGQTDAAFAAMAKDGAQAVLVQDSVILARYSEQVVAMALKHRLPSISQIPTFAERGGLLQYGADIFEMFRRSAGHVDRILKGAKAGELPIEQPTKVDLIVNQRTAKALGITIPRAILARADRVID
jgi:putative ABC transport system substrate-binding protein